MIKILPKFLYRPWKFAFSFENENFSQGFTVIQTSWFYSLYEWANKKPKHFWEKSSYGEMTSYFKTSIKLQNEKPGEYILKGQHICHSNRADHWEAGLHHLSGVYYPLQRQGYSTNSDGRSADLCLSSACCIRKPWTG